MGLSIIPTSDKNQFWASWPFLLNQPISTQLRKVMGSFFLLLTGFLNFDGSYLQPVI